QNLSVSVTRRVISAPVSGAAGFISETTKYAKNCEVESVLRESWRYGKSGLPALNNGLQPLNSFCLYRMATQQQASGRPADQHLARHGRRTAIHGGICEYGQLTFCHFVRFESLMPVSGTML